MRISSFINLIKNGQLSLLLKLSKWSNAFYKLDYVTALYENGFNKALSTGPKSLEELSKVLHIPAESKDALEAWLQAAVKLKILSLDDGCYALSGMSERLAQPENDALLAITQEITTLHHKLIMDTPKRLHENKLWTLEDQDGDMIARSSRIVEPLQHDMITSLFPSSGEVQLLEIGCGSGIYMRYAAEHNPQLKVTGVELQEDVVKMAQENISTWGVDDRVTVQQGNILDTAFDHEFDIVSLYNNIYYFPVETRVGLLKQLLTFVKPGGFLVLTTACQGGQPMSELLNLWGASTENCGRLPHVEEMVEQMETAGFVNVEANNLVAGDSFYSFVGYRS